MSLLLKVACPECGHPHDSAALGAELRCTRCGRDFRAAGDGDNASRVISVTPDELDEVPYSQRSIEVPVNKVSSIIVADPALLSDKLLRDVPMKDNARWVGKVRLLKKLGQGGMGAVYRGYDEDLALDVAVKILPQPLGTGTGTMGERDAQFVARFRQEARISAQINHPHVVRTLHVEEQGDLIYLVMDYIQGSTARGLVDARGPLPVPLALQIIQDAARGVHAAHEHGVIHRDIKPDNILVADDGRVLISDLGLAKAVGTGAGGGPARMPVTRMGLLLGTPHYMSPEQWNIGASCGPSTDIWSLGATLWMLLTRMPPFDDKDTGILAQQIKEKPLPEIREIRQGLPDSVVDILHYCMAKKPEERFGDCAALIAAIDWSLNDLSATQGNGCRPRPAPFPLRTTAATVAPAAPAIGSIGLMGSIGPIGAAAENSLPVQAPLIRIAGAAPAVEARRPAWTQAPSAPNASAAPLWQPVPPKPRGPRIWAAAIAAALLLGGVVLLIARSGSNGAASAAHGSGPTVPVELHNPARVKPGEMAEFSAIVNGGGGVSPDYSIVWLSGERSFAGSSVRVALEHDTEFTLIVRDASSAVELARRTFKVDVELEAKAAESGVVSAESGSVVKLHGKVRGGSDTASLETRWIDAGHGDAVLAAGANLTIAEKDATPGRRALAFQARRKGDAEWTTDRLTVEIVRSIPPEYAALVTLANEAQAEAARAETGIESAAGWRKAVEALEKAGAIFPAGNAEAPLRSCREHLAMEEKYLSLVAEARKLKIAAEQLPASDGVGRLTAWSEACRPYSAALALFDRAEVRFEAASAQSQAEQLKTELKSAEQTRAAFDSGISKARHAAAEGKKYVSPSVALPFWEDAFAQFAELRRKFPKRADEFALEFQDVEENRDKAYLQVMLGVVPAMPRDRERKREPPAATPPAAAPPRTNLVPQPQVAAPKMTPAPSSAAPRNTPLPEPVHGEDKHSK